MRFHRGKHSLSFTHKTTSTEGRKRKDNVCKTTSAHFNNLLHCIYIYIYIFEMSYITVMTKAFAQTPNVVEACLVLKALFQGSHCQHTTTQKTYSSSPLNACLILHCIKLQFKNYSNYRYFKHLRTRVQL